MYALSYVSYREPTRAAFTATHTPRTDTERVGVSATMGGSALREPSASSAPETSSDTSSRRLEAENRELRRKLQQLTDLCRDPTSASQSPATAPPSRYHVEQMSEGFWDGLYRARCGFRVIGLYESQQEAQDHACLDYAMVQQRIQPTAAQMPSAALRNS